MKIIRLLYGSEYHQALSRNGQHSRIIGRGYNKNGCFAIVRDASSLPMYAVTIPQGMYSEIKM